MEFNMKNVLIIGLGEFGRHFAHKMVELGSEVRLIDADENVINALSSDFDDAMIGDCRNENTVSQLGVSQYDICVVSVGGDFQASLEITSNLKAFGAKFIISQCESDIQSKFLHMAGADKTIYPEKDAAQRAAIIYNEDKLIDYISVSDDCKIGKVLLPKSWQNKTLFELDIRRKYNLNVIAVERDGKITTPDANVPFLIGDMVLVLGDEASLQKLFEI